LTAATGDLACRQFVNQFDIRETAGLKPEINGIIGEKGLRVCEAFETVRVSSCSALRAKARSAQDSTPPCWTCL
jgi:hypothetical protein